VWLPLERVKVRKTFPRLDEAKSWRTDALKAVKDGKVKAPSKMTLREVADAWLAQAKSGEALTRAGTRYKPVVIREHERLLWRTRMPPGRGLATADLLPLVMLERLFPVVDRLGSECVATLADRDCLRSCGVGVNHERRERLHRVLV